MQRGQDSPGRDVSIPPRLGQAVAALILGSVGVCWSLFGVGVVPAVAGVVLSVMLLVRRSYWKRMAWWGLSLSAAGIIIGLPCLRLRGDYLAIATLGFAAIMATVIINFQWLGGATGFPILGGPGWPKVGIIFQPRGQGILGMSGAVERELFYLLVTWFLVGFTILFIRNLMRSTHGRADQRTNSRIALCSCRGAHKQDLAAPVTPSPQSRPVLATPRSDCCARSPCLSVV